MTVVRFVQCRDFIRDGAEHGNTPSEVVQACDITFSCVSDPTALKDVLLQFCRLLMECTFLQCFDTVGWAAGMASGPLAG